jgi:hypothetical protein
MLEDRAFQIARDGVAKLVLHEGKPVIVDGKRLYEVKYETPLLMKLLAGRDREKYGEYKVVEIHWKDWDGDIRNVEPERRPRAARCTARGSRETSSRRGGE